MLVGAMIVEAAETLEIAITEEAGVGNSVRH